MSLPVLTPEQNDRLERWLQHLLWEQQYLTLPIPADLAGSQEEQPRVDILRCKGIWGTTDGGAYILQGVKNLYEINREAAAAWEPGAAGKLVLIGKGIERARPDLQASVLKVDSVAS